MGDAQFIYDWKRSKFVLVPIGFQIGKLTKLGKQPARFFFNPQYNARNLRGCRIGRSLPG